MHMTGQVNRKESYGHSTMLRRKVGGREWKRRAYRTRQVWISL